MKALLLAIVLAASTLVHSPGAWTQFRLNAASNAVLSGTLSVEWTRATGGGYSSSPVLVDGTLYAANNDGWLYALDPATGRIRWKYHGHNALMAQPIVFGGSVIESEGDARPIMGTTLQDPVRVGGGPNALFAVDARSGALQWRTVLPGSGMPTPAILDGVLVNHDGAGFISGTDPRDGHTLYRLRLPSVASMSAVRPIAGDRYLTGGSFEPAVFALRAHDPALVWRHLFPSNAGGVGDCPAASDGVYLFCNYLVFQNDALFAHIGDPATMHAYALRLSDGATVWDVPLERGKMVPRNESAIPLVTGYAVYEGSAIAPYVHALDRKTGKLRWRLRAHGAIKGGLVERAGVVYFGDLAGYLYAADARTGVLLGSRHFPTAFNVGSPILAGRTIFDCGKNGLIVALRIGDLQAPNRRSRSRNERSALENVSRSKSGHSTGSVTSSL